VLNDQPGQTIPPSTRSRVLAAAKDLGYTPNAAARALRAGQSNIVLLAVRNIPYGRNLGLLVDRLAVRVAEQGMTLMIWEPAAGQSLRTTLGHLQPRYALSLLQLEPDEIEALQVAGIPYATSEPNVGVSQGDELTGSLQVHHLAERGHRSIGHLGTEDADLLAFTGPRRAGVRRGCLELGLPAPRDAAMPVPPRGRLDDVVPVIEDWHAAGITGIAAYNDYLAAQCLRAADRLGLRVPDQLAVIGVDDDPMSALLDPPLTTVRIDMAALADRLLGLVLHSPVTGTSRRTCPPGRSRSWCARPPDCQILWLSERPQHLTTRGLPRVLSISCSRECAPVAPSGVEGSGRRGVLRDRRRCARRRTAPELRGRGPAGRRRPGRRP
jgi:DNA-binding LacI/PurR family transcriptional regulator